MSLELVIAKYNEDISWLSQINCNTKITIYDKSGTDKLEKNHVILPNVGREGHTYLYHILNRYDSLSEYTCFLQGDPFPHDSKILEKINNFDVSESQDTIFFGSFHSESIFSFDCAAHPHGLPMWYFLDLLFGIKAHRKQNIGFFAGAQFIVHKDSILSKPKSFYEFLIKFLSYEVNPIEGYVLERLWPKILDSKILSSKKYLLFYNSSLNTEELVDLIRRNNNYSIESMYNLILSLGLNNELLNEQPIELSDYYGKGLKIWQYPNQLSKFANYLSSIHAKSYLEIGCRYGGTFIFNSEILAKNNPNITLYACDTIPKSHILRDYEKIREFEYIQEPSTSETFKKRFINNEPEFVFIDGDHSYFGVKNDFEIFRNMVNTKYIVLHDIYSDVCPGVKKLWTEIKNDYYFDTIEFCDQYESVNGNFLGIGIAIRK